MRAVHSSVTHSIFGIQKVFRPLLIIHCVCLFCFVTVGYKNITKTCFLMILQWLLKHVSMVLLVVQWIECVPNFLRLILNLDRSLLLQTVYLSARKDNFQNTFSWGTGCFNLTWESSRSNLPQAHSDSPPLTVFVAGCDRQSISCTYFSTYFLN